MDKQAGETFFNFPDYDRCSLHLLEVTHSDCLAVEHFADAVLRDDFFFKKGHWLSLVSDSRVQLLVVRALLDDNISWSEILGVVVLYADSVLHNLFLSKHVRGLGLGSAIIEAIQPSTIRSKVDMSTGDPSGFYARLGFTHEQAREGKRGQISVLVKPPTSTRSRNLKTKKADRPEGSDGPPRDS